MSKRNITYVKPEEPNFLKELKKQAGYKEGPTVDTKREDLGPAQDLSDGEEEQPTVVVLKEGDLTAQEAQREKERLEKEEAETPADLSASITFKPPNKAKTVENRLKRKSVSSENGPKSSKDKISRNKLLLSFDEEEDDD